MKVYFAGSIRGGREDAILYRQIIAKIQKSCIVLTEHIGKENLDELEKDQSDEEIYQQDISFMKQADLVIAECTTASLGVGYELAYAEKLGLPVYVFYQKQRCHLSAMINGNHYFKVYPYSTKEEILELVINIIKQEYKKKGF